MTNRELGNAARAALRKMGITNNDVSVKIETGFAERWIDAEIKNPSISCDAIRPVLESVITGFDKSDTSVCVYSYSERK